MKKHLFLAIITILFLTSFSCESTTTGPSDVGSWFPMTLNSTWFSTMGGDWINAEGDTTTTWTGSFDTKVTAEVQHNGGFTVFERRSYRTMTNTTPDSTWTDIDTLYYYYQEIDDELRCYSDLNTTEYKILLKFPLTLNETWSHNDSTGTRLEVLSLSETVSVAAGSFSDCALVREIVTIGTTDWTTDHYYHRGAGNVKNILTTSGMYGTIELQTYDIK